VASCSSWFLGGQNMSELLGISSGRLSWEYHLELFSFRSWLGCTKTTKRELHERGLTTYWATSKTHPISWIPWWVERSSSNPTQK
jgi:hypothetical protein